MIASLTVISFMLAADPTGAVTLGVAEEFSTGDWDSPVAPQVRVAFRRSHQGWEALPWDAAESTKMKWTACFDGRVLGKVETQSGGFERSANRGAQVPLANQSIPFPGERSKEFAGWMGADVFHPLALTTSGRCADPDGWHPVPPTAELRKRLVAAFIAAAGPDRCEGTKTVPWKPKDEDVEIRKVYASRRGEWLGIAKAKSPSDLCDGPAGEDALTQLFKVDARGKVTRLGVGLTIVDAGDYDGDGRSEVLARFARYNDDGYTLFYDGLAKQVSFEWGYH
jgi:hypothetical protein